VTYIIIGVVILVVIIGFMLILARAAGTADEKLNQK
jgi:hypothetical protein